MKNNTTEIAQAIYILNKHAKNAPELYAMKKRAIEKLMKQGKAKKVGLNYSPNPGKALQRLDVLIQVEEYLFHLPSSRGDRKTLEILEYDADSRNPKVMMPLKRAKEILEQYAPSPKPTVPNKPKPKPKPPQKYVGLSSYLNGSPKKY
ncbi:YkyB family protein [Fictibacillus sp. WQ 8-8]|uniref:YkyB family protein n=1 Tax=Fictibacillus sp. WQ 8-8 TaxID=2938788 RepID=UPI00210A885F|nr:YkyB family protein [Fictibacillus sp. WQ 8-8]MCQ6264720.1 YkyB family protein [Fictibacillus sp. WQ 8-8]